MCLACSNLQAKAWDDVNLLVFPSLVYAIFMKARSQYLWLVTEEFGTIPEAQFSLLVWRLLFDDRSVKQKKGEGVSMCVFVCVCV